MLQESGKGDLQGKKMQRLCCGRRDCACGSCVYPWGWSALWHKCYFMNIFISLPVLKLVVVELVLQNTDLRGAVDAQMLAWDVLLPVRGWSGSSKNTISSKIPPFSQASFEVIQVSLLKSLLQPRVYGHPRAILAITTKSHLCSLPFRCHWSFCMF